MNISNLEFLKEISKRHQMTYDEPLKKILNGANYFYIDFNIIYRSEMFGLLKFLGSPYNYDSTNDFLEADGYIITFNDLNNVDKIDSTNAEFSTPNECTWKCCCGAEKVGANRHSYWCNVYREDYR